MNLREPPQVPQGMRRAGPFLCLLLVAAVQEMGLSSAHAGTLFPASNLEAPSGGYLRCQSAPPLRFAEVVLPATPVAQVAAVTPVKKPTGVTTAAGAANHSADASATVDVSLRPNPSSGATPGKTEPLSIISDEARPQVRPEDFLPYFQIPGTGGTPGITVVVPGASGQTNPPPQTSSATYLQTDK